MFLNRDQASRLIASKGDLTLAQSLEELGISVALIRDDLAPEDWFVIGHKLAWGARFQTAVVGNLSAVGLQLSGDSIPKIVIVEQWTISIGVASTVSIRVADSAVYGGSGGPFSRDGQIGSMVASVGGMILLADNNAAALGTSTGDLTLGAADPFSLPANQSSPVAIMFNGSKGDLTRQLIAINLTANATISNHFMLRVLEIRGR